MSFILDALKKSEMERQRQSTPGLVESGIARPRSHLPIWAIALCALLAVNLIVLIVMLTRGSHSPPASAPERPDAHDRVADKAADGAQPAPRSSAATIPANAEPAPGQPGATHFSPLDAAPEYAPEIPAAGQPAAAAPLTAPAAVSKPAWGMPVSPNARTVHRHDPVLTNDDYMAGEETLPSINEINLEGAQALPDLHLDVHVYATQSAERFVFINMRKYHEGATLQEGPTIERIRRDGVVLSYQGLRFLLPRQ